MKKMTHSLALLLLTISFLSCDNNNRSEGIYAQMNTNRGDMVLKLYYKETPVTVANFITLAEGTNPYVQDSLKSKPFYDGIIFHRVIKDFMIQGGDPAGRGTGGPGYKFKDETKDSLVFDQKGLFAMANAGPGTNGSQFFITLKETPHLNGRHTIFGKLEEGMAVLDTIGNTLTSKDPNTRDKPIDKVVINSVKISRVGKDAKAFDALKVFTHYMENRDKAKKEMLVEFQKQKEEANAFPSGLKKIIITEGNKEKPKNGDKININYAGYLSDGTLFDTSWLEVAQHFDRVNQARQASNGYAPMNTIMSEKMQFIPGFNEALFTMTYGEKARVFIPANLGWGERGSGPIPPNSDVVFDIELLKSDKTAK